MAGTNFLTLSDFYFINMDDINKKIDQYAKPAVTIRTKSYLLEYLKPENIREALAYYDQIARKAINKETPRLLEELNKQYRKELGDMENELEALFMSADILTKRGFEIAKEFNDMLKGKLNYEALLKNAKTIEKQHDHNLNSYYKYIEDQYSLFKNIYNRYKTIYDNKVNRGLELKKLLEQYEKEKKRKDNIPLSEFFKPGFLEKINLMLIDRKIVWVENGEYKWERPVVELVGFSMAVDELRSKLLKLKFDNPTQRGYVFLRYYGSGAEVRNFQLKGKGAKAKDKLIKAETERNRYFDFINNIISP